MSILESDRVQLGRFAFATGDKSEWVDVADAAWLDARASGQFNSDRVAGNAVVEALFDRIREETGKEPRYYGLENPYGMSWIELSILAAGNENPTVRQAAARGVAKEFSDVWRYPGRGNLVTRRQRAVGDLEAQLWALARGEEARATGAAGQGQTYTGEFSRELLEEMRSWNTRAQIIGLRRERGENLADLLSRSSALTRLTAPLAGGVAASFTDPLQVATGLIGGSARTILGAALEEAGISVAMEAALQPVIASREIEAGGEYTARDAGINLGAAAIFGAVLGGGFKAGETVVFGSADYRDARRALETLPEDHPGRAVLGGKRRDVIEAAQAMKGELDAAAQEALGRELARLRATGVVPDGVSVEAHGRHVDEMTEYADAPEAGPPPVAPEPAPPVRGVDLSDPSSPRPKGVFQVEGKPVSQRRIDITQLTTDAQAMQYKGGADAEGVTRRLSGVERWNPVLANELIVWERADGTLVVGDGHQRTGLGQRLVRAGAEEKIEVTANVMREVDGWSAEDVRAVAAKKNIAEGSGDPVDAARIMRDRPDIVDDSLPVTGDFIAQARALARLSDAAWGMVVNGLIRPNLAAVIGRYAGNPATHGAIAQAMAEARPSNEVEARVLVGQVLEAGFARETQATLFGLDTREMSLLQPKMKLITAVVKQLRNDARVFGLLEREAERIEAAGNALARDGNQRLAETSAQVQELLVRLATRRGPISARLNEATRAIVDGESTRAAEARRLADELRAEIEAGGVEALLAAPDAGDPGPARVFDGDEDAPGEDPGAGLPDPDQGALFSRPGGQVERLSDLMALTGDQLDAWADANVRQVERPAGPMLRLTSGLEAGVDDITVNIDQVPDGSFEIAFGYKGRTQAETGGQHNIVVAQKVFSRAMAASVQWIRSNTPSYVAFHGATPAHDRLYVAWLRRKVPEGYTGYRLVKRVETTDIGGSGDTASVSEDALLVLVRDGENIDEIRKLFTGRDIQLPDTASGQRRRRIGRADRIDPRARFSRGRNGGRRAGDPVYGNAGRAAGEERADPGGNRRDRGLGDQSLEMASRTQGAARDGRGLADDDPDGRGRGDVLDPEGAGQGASGRGGDGGNPGAAQAGQGASGPLRRAFFSFAGEGARNIPVRLRLRAEEMAGQGASELEIFRETGFTLGADGKPRWELDDSQSGFVAGAKAKLEGGVELDTYTGSFFSHDLLYEAYPKLKGIALKIRVGDGLAEGGLYDPNRVAMEVRAPNLEAARIVILHELQHAIQYIEGFAFGGMPAEMAAPDASPALMMMRIGQAVEMAREAGLDWKDLDGPTKDTLLQAADFELYMRLAGEVEARNVMTRANMSQGARALSFPADTEDRARARQVLRAARARVAGSVKKPASLEDLRAALEPALGGLLRELEESGRLVFARRASDVLTPEDVGGANPADFDDANGVHLDGVTYLFTDQVTPETAPQVLLHEIGIHAGLDGLVGEKGKAQLLKSVRELIREGDGAALAALADVPADTPGMPARKGALPTGDALEEVLARLAEAGAGTSGLARLAPRMASLIYQHLPFLRAAVEITPDMVGQLALAATRREGWNAALENAGNYLAWRRLETLLDAVSPRAPATGAEPADEAGASPEPAEVPEVAAQDVDGPGALFGTVPDEAGGPARDWQAGQKRLAAMVERFEGCVL